MSYEEFVELVRKLRAAQKAYFRYRDGDRLTEAKSLEKAVDTELEKGPRQQPLFGDEP